ncbi:hypothetical protein [Candidatus Palauibacter sp.]|uniref:hypothetical protein n=1 Tax=Candidatus Palauibacter sp. TaxID=3101350 RepID=UPI003B52D173
MRADSHIADGEVDGFRDLALRGPVIVWASNWPEALSTPRYCVALMQAFGSHASGA